jgi:hypothetical protein
MKQERNEAGEEDERSRRIFLSSYHYFLNVLLRQNPFLV